MSSREDERRDTLTLTLHSSLRCRLSYFFDWQSLDFQPTPRCCVLISSTAQFSLQTMPTPLTNARPDAVDAASRSFEHTFIGRGRGRRSAVVEKSARVWFADVLRSRARENLWRNFYELFRFALVCAPSSSAVDSSLRAGCVLTRDQSEWARSHRDISLITAINFHCFTRQPTQQRKERKKSDEFLIPFLSAFSLYLLHLSVFTSLSLACPALQSMWMCLSNIIN